MRGSQSIGGCVAALLLFDHYPAAANATEQYRVEAGETDRINVNVCEGRSRLTVRGDKDTDLDFTVRDAAGTIVHRDSDRTDFTFATLAGTRGQCVKYVLEVKNLGDVYNAYSVEIASIGDATPAAAGGAFSRGERTLSVAAGTTQRTTLSMCAPHVKVYANGNGASDLDFTIWNDRSEVVHRDNDTTDLTIVTLDTGIPSGGACRPFVLAVRNVGSAANTYVLRLTPQ